MNSQLKALIFFKICTKQSVYLTTTELYLEIKQLAFQGGSISMAIMPVA